MIFRETFTRFSNVDECRAVGIFVPLFISEGIVQDVPKNAPIKHKIKFLTILDPLGPSGVWTLLDNFRQKSICCPRRTKLGLAEVLLSKK